MKINACIGIGANLGNAQETVLLAVDRIASLPDSFLMAQSSLYQSAPIDSSGDDYINAVVEIATDLSAENLLKELQEIELAFGRERPYHNAPRTLDLDILLYGSEMIRRRHLQVPHPRMTERAFVLLPLVEILPDTQIPEKGAASSFLPAVADQVLHKLVDDSTTTSKSLDFP